MEYHYLFQVAQTPISAKIMTCQVLQVDSYSRNLFLWIIPCSIRLISIILILYHEFNNACTQPNSHKVNTLFGFKNNKLFLGLWKMKHHFLQEEWFSPLYLGSLCQGETQIFPIPLFPLFSLYNTSQRNILYSREFNIIIRCIHWPLNFLHESSLTLSLTQHWIPWLISKNTPFLMSIKDRPA